MLRRLYSGLLRGFPLLKQKQCDPYTHIQNRYKSPHFMLILRVLREFYKMTLLESSTNLFYIRPSICKMFNITRSYDGGFTGEHTIMIGYYNHIINYNCARTPVKESLITFPISISKIGLSAHSKHRKTYQVFKSFRPYFC